MSLPESMAELPLFPLQAVLFPGGQMGLKIFEARYLDLVSRCLRERQPFGVVCLRQGRDTTRDGVLFEDIGTLATIDEVDGEQQGILHVRCSGGSRFALAGAARQQPDGLWHAPVHALADDTPEHPAPAMLATVQALAQAIAKLKAQGALPFAEPFRLDDAGWVANRWCELLPIPLLARHKLMALESPSLRLKIVDEFLRGKQVIG